jgi:hypothetical protein
MFGNAIVFAPMAFGLIPKVLDAIDVIVGVCKQFAVVNPIVLEL